MNETIEGILIIFGLFTMVWFIGYLISSKERFLKPLVNKKESTVYRLNGFGTCMLGWNVLDEEQLKYYGFKQFEHNGKMYWPLAKYKTMFISLLWVPFLPLKTQIIIDNDNGSFYAFPVELYHKQAFKILFITYFIILSLILLIVYGVTVIFSLLIGAFIVLVLIILKKDKKSEENNILGKKKDESKEEKEYISKIKSVGENPRLSEVDKKEDFDIWLDRKFEEIKK